MAQPGYVYALINPSMPGLVKVGRTERDPSVRVSELSGVTGVATPFILVFYQAFEDCALAERHAHAALERHGQRFSANREFFETEPTSAIRAIMKAPGATDQVPTTEMLNRGEAASQSSLLDELVSRARAYRHGNEDVPQDVKEAVKLYIKAGKLGSGIAYYELSDMYGYGGPFMPDGWLAKNSKSNEAKKQEYIRKACELNYAPAWADIAYERKSNSSARAEAQAWRKFFEIALRDTPQHPTEVEGSSDWRVTYGALRFLTPRGQLQLGYFPCTARIDDEVLSVAVEFMKQRSDTVIEAVEQHVRDQLSSQWIIDPCSSYNAGEDPEVCRARLVAGWREALRWLNEL